MAFSIPRGTAFPLRRRSEALGLRWKDVHLDLATLSVAQVMHRQRGGRTVFLEPKTEKGRRSMALSPTAVLTLRAHRQRQEADRELVGIPLTADDLVISHPDGSPLLTDTVTHGFQRILSKAGLQGVRLHDLRHTHASLMLKQNVHPKVVQERLGHASISTTLDTYSHVLPGLQEAAALRFEEELTQPARVSREVVR